MNTLPLSIRRGARLDAVARAVAAASGPTRLIYVERRGSLYRWSPAHRGGPYPLLRETAVILGADHHRLIVPFRGLPTGLCIVAAEESAVSGPERPWMVLGFTAPVTASAVRSRILRELDPPADEPAWRASERALGRKHGVIHLMDDEAVVIPVRRVPPRTRRDDS